MRDPHNDQPVARAGASTKEAAAAVILLHGRGASAGSMLQFADEFQTPGEPETVQEPPVDASPSHRIAFLAPQAAGHAWYPYSFLAPVSRNEPGLSSGLSVIGRLIDELEADGIPASRIVLLGFSQGACLAGEYAARNARRYGGVVMLSGGLIGEGGDDPFGAGNLYAGGPDRERGPEHAPLTPMDGTPVFLGCSDIDAHIPLERVQASSGVFRKLGADVTERIYPGMGHTVNMDEIGFVRTLLDTLQT